MIGKYAPYRTEDLWGLDYIPEVSSRIDQRAPLNVRIQDFG